MVAAAFQYMQKTRHIAVDVGLRMFEAITYSGLCSQVDYRIEVPFREDARADQDRKSEVVTDKQLLRRIPEKSQFKSMRNRSFPSRTGIPLYPLPQLYVQANGPL